MRNACATDPCVNAFAKLYSDVRTALLHTLCAGTALKNVHYLAVLIGLQPHAIHGGSEGYATGHSGSNMFVLTVMLQMFSCRMQGVGKL